MRDFGEIENSDINEASGICASKKNSNVLWLHNDSGDYNRIFAISLDGKHLGEYYLNNSGVPAFVDIYQDFSNNAWKKLLYLRCDRQR